MRIESVTVYQPAATLRAVMVQLQDDGSCSHWDVPIVGIQAVLRSWPDEGDEHDVKHEVLFLDDNRVTTEKGLREHYPDMMLTVASAHLDAECWENLLKRAHKALSCKKERESKKRTPPKDAAA